MSTTADTTQAADPTLGGLLINGPDAATFLQGYLTSDTEQLTAGIGQRTALTTLKGRVLANGWAVEVADGVLLLLAADMLQPVADFLKKYLAFSKSSARIMDPDELQNTLHTTQLAGLPATPQPLAAALFEARLPLVTVATTDQFLPQMLGLTDQEAVDFTKGCYLGQEIVARAEHRGAVKRRLYAFTAAAPTTASAAAPQPGDAVASSTAQRQVGTVVLVDAQNMEACRVLAVVSTDAVDEPSDATSVLTTGPWNLTPVS